MSGDTQGLFGNPPADYSTQGGGSVAPLIDASTGFNSGWSFDIPKTADTATVNAIQSMAPITANNQAGESDWSGFWQHLVGSVVQTGASVYAANNGVTQPASTQPAVAVPRQSGNQTLLLVALGVGVVLLLTHKA